MIPLIKYFINALQIYTAELTSTTYLKKQADLDLLLRELDRDFAGGSVPFCASELTVVD